MRAESEAEQAMDKYGDTVCRLCFVHLRNREDTEDVFQEVFLKYILSDVSFQSEEHEKAWFIRVTINACKDIIKSFLKRKVGSIEDMHVEPYVHSKEDDVLLEFVLKLPVKYKTVLYLFYYEDYSAVEIAQIMNKNVNTIYTWLSRAKVKLKNALGGDFFA